MFFETVIVLEIFFMNYIQNKVLTGAAIAHHYRFYHNTKSMGEWKEYVISLAII